VDLLRDWLIEEQNLLKGKGLGKKAERRANLWGVPGKLALERGVNGKGKDESPGEERNLLSQTYIGKKIYEMTAKTAEERGSPLIEKKRPEILQKGKKRLGKGKKNPRIKIWIEEKKGGKTGLTDKKRRAGHQMRT